MTDNQVGIVCGLIAWLSFVATIAFRAWLDHKEVMKGKQ